MILQPSHFVPLPFIGTQMPTVTQRSALESLWFFLMEVDLIKANMIIVDISDFSWLSLPLAT